MSENNAENKQNGNKVVVGAIAFKNGVSVFFRELWERLLELLHGKVPENLMQQIQAMQNDIEKVTERLDEMPNYIAATCQNIGVDLKKVLTDAETAIKNEEEFKLNSENFEKLRYHVKMFKEVNFEVSQKKILEFCEKNNINVDDFNYCFLNDKIYVCCHNAEDKTKFDVFGIDYKVDGEITVLDFVTKGTMEENEIKMMKEEKDGSFVNVYKESKSVLAKWFEQEEIKRSSDVTESKEKLENMNESFLSTCKGKEGRMVDGYNLHYYPKNEKNNMNVLYQTDKTNNKQIRYQFEVGTDGKYRAIAYGYNIVKGKDGKFTTSGNKVYVGEIENGGISKVTNKKVDKEFVDMFNSDAIQENLFGVTPEKSLARKLLKKSVYNGITNDKKITEEGEYEISCLFTAFEKANKDKPDTVIGAIEGGKGKRVALANTNGVLTLTLTENGKPQNLYWQEHIGNMALTEPAYLGQFYKGTFKPDKEFSSIKNDDIISLMKSLDASYNELKVEGKINVSTNKQTENER